MSIKADLHLHSSFSGDSQASMKSMIEKAISLGLEHVCFTEHMDIDYTRESPLSFMGRTGSDRENANLICVLASEDASYIAAQNIQIDGCRKKQ